MTLNKRQNGFLSLEELKNGFEAEGMQQVEQNFRLVLGKKPDVKLEWDKVFRCIDTDQDGKLGFEEVLTAASDRQKLITGENYLEQAFDILDKDKDGKITLEELQKAFSDKVDKQTWDDVSILFHDINKK